jgi:hypothetical protein
MKDLPPDRWRFPREPIHYQRFALCAIVIFWTSIVIGSGKGALAILNLILTAIELMRYGAPSGIDGLDLLFRGGTDLAQAVGLVFVGMVASGILTMMTDIARNVRRHRMVAEIAHGLKPVDLAESR